SKWLRCSLTYAKLVQTEHNPKNNPFFLCFLEVPYQKEKPLLPETTYKSHPTKHFKEKNHQKVWQIQK
ncbi:MAG: hypothetical protein ACI3YF_10205, partial [Prevotella sp.]